MLKRNIMHCRYSSSKKLKVWKTNPQERNGKICLLPALPGACHSELSESPQRASQLGNYDVSDSGPGTLSAATGNDSARDSARDKSNTNDNPDSGSLRSEFRSPERKSTSNGKNRPLYNSASPARRNLRLSRDIPIGTMPCHKKATPRKGSPSQTGTLTSSGSTPLGGFGTPSVRVTATPKRSPSNSNTNRASLPPRVRGRNSGRDSGRHRDSDLPPSERRPPTPGGSASHRNSNRNSTQTNKNGGRFSNCSSSIQGRRSGGSGAHSGVHSGRGSGRFSNSGTGRFEASGRFEVSDADEENNANDSTYKTDLQSALGALARQQTAFASAGVQNHVGGKSHNPNRGASTTKTQREGSPGSGGNKIKLLTNDDDLTMSLSVELSPDREPNPFSGEKNADAYAGDDGEQHLHVLAGTGFDENGEEKCISTLY
jgi:hypothetical protein